MGVGAGWHLVVMCQLWLGLKASTQASINQWAGPKAKNQAWPGLALAQARAFAKVM